MARHFGVRTVVLRLGLGLLVSLGAGGAQAQLRVDDAVQALEQGDRADAISILARLAQAGDRVAQHNIGLLARDPASGLDPGDAAHWLQRAATQGFAPAKLALADHHAGQGDWTAAAPWYEAAAKAGAPDAQMALALILDRGLAGAADPPGAQEWYLRAAGQGHVAAKFALGSLLVDQNDPEQAVIWFERAAHRGHTGAQFNLALALATGSGTRPDLAGARGWYARAARAGVAAAMHNLALMQARGQGGLQDPELALVWALAAREAGFGPADDLVAGLAEILPAAALDRATARMATCLSGDDPACD